MITEPRFPAHIASLRPHIAGVSLPELARRHGLQERDIAKLDSNENPLGASPLALQALAETRQDPSIYPDTDSSVLVSRLAEVYGLDADWIVVGAGSESLLGITVTTLLAAGRKTVYSQYSFVAYANAVQRVGAVAIVVPEPDFMVDLAALHDALAQQPVLIYIANPGNPTGTCVAPEALREFLHAVPPNVVVLLDEAYLEFMPPSLRPDALALVRALPNLIVTRTFSKAYGLAGLRVGYAIAQPALVACGSCNCPIWNPTPTSYWSRWEMAQRWPSDWRNVACWCVPSASMGYRNGRVSGLARNYRSSTCCTHCAKCCASRA
ncbi:MAG: aminotransferase class I/II-fold pyridoxal phosphate-dependent enzyme [Betaproteobacteria bacterium]|nr:aminotransferase class I/II-fold pyridoxal phosphate-dependent enzyme [Betaproteobacteria bacterium]